MQTITDMKIQYSNQISSFGGINFVLNEFNDKQIHNLINNNQLSDNIVWFINWS